MTQTTLIADTRFLNDLFNAGGQGELDRLADQYDNIVVPEEVLGMLENFDQRPAIESWLNDLGDQATILPAVDVDVLLDAFPGNYNSNQILSEGLDSTAYPILHATQTGAVSDAGLTIATNNADIMGYLRDGSSADVILGVHNYLDRQIAGDAISGDEYETLHAEATQATRYNPYNAFETDEMSLEDIQMYRDAGAGPEDIPTLMHNDSRSMFLDAENTERVFANPTLQTLTRITPEGTDTQIFETSQEAMHAFGDLRMEAYNADPELFEGSLPATVAGDLRALTDAYTNKIDPDFGQRVGQRFGDIGEFIGRGTKVLGPVGVLQGLHEAGELGRLSNDLVEEGLMSQAAADDYTEILEKHLVQGTLDPTMFGLELKVQNDFDAVMEAHDVHPALQEMLEPGSVLEDIGHAIGYVAGIEPDEPWREGTSMTDAISQLHQDQLAIEFDHRELQDYPPEYDRMTSAQTQETFETLLAEDHDRLPIELPEDLTREERVSALLDSAEEVFAEAGYDREIPLEPDVTTPAQDYIPPTRDDISDGYDAGPF